MNYMDCVDWLVAGNKSIPIPESIESTYRDYASGFGDKYDTKDIVNAKGVIEFICTKLNKEDKELAVDGLKKIISHVRRDYKFLEMYGFDVMSKNCIRDMLKKQESENKNNE